LHNAVKYDLQISAVGIHPSKEPLHHIKKPTPSGNVREMWGQTGNSDSW